jgi:phenylalanyl-tRNA synthetase beta chain
MIVDVDLHDLLVLLNRDLDLKELEEHLFLLKCEIENVENDMLSIDVNPDRTDMLSVEGIARALKGFIGIEVGAPKYRVFASKWSAIVDPSVNSIRPYLACGILRGVSLTSNLIADFMQFQERLTGTFGRNRKKTSIGLYDLDLITPPIHYRADSPKSIRFVPLEFYDELDAKEILRLHPKGQEFGSILSGLKRYPVLVDAEGQVLSMPPIINSNDLGRITETTENLFVEVTGTHKLTTIQTLNIMITALADRGGRMCSVEIIYPENREKLPSFQLEYRTVPLTYINENIGYSFKADTIKRALKRMRLDCTVQGDDVRVGIPSYRVDILHNIDVVEDVAIGYGFNRIEPTLPTTMTVGQELPLTTLQRTIRDLMVGLNYQEIYNYVLTNTRLLFEKMNQKLQSVVEVSNPKSMEYHVTRNALLPGLLSFLSENTAQELPHRIFELGDVVLIQPKAETRTQTIPYLAAAVVDSQVDLTQLKAELMILLQNLGLKGRVTNTKHPSFIPGRVGYLRIDRKRRGIIGEVHPQVLRNFGIEAPCVAFEFEIDPSWA